MSGPLELRQAWHGMAFLPFCGDEAPKFSRSTYVNILSQALSLSLSLSISLSVLRSTILAMDKFTSDVQTPPSKKPAAEPEDAAAPEKKALPKGVVLGKDGKP